ncbi:type IV pilin protein [Neisseria sp. DTU_2021_1001991_1_SI_NGA_ILE_055]|uniref:type IV pilin protein n=1 Tax=Neisseria sp. DTU_2021_1001991_1_SI_NGA_ILE_055 TaxID=3077590 RepID=UPI0028EFA2D1|nr:type IV pilin protein [Neisseria sp. DTU_2021_1001991_1_SI_NGA_ILE_055]WNS82684.1 type IV pilin protein [Neisseria sp. DTU_2021_1001991_1_SI_NGA_ILE_055]
MKHQQGFTLIELLIVVLIAAILATIAYPSYQNYIRQTRLASVRTQMLHNAQQLERYYTQKRTFKDFPPKNLQQNEYFDINFSKDTASMPNPSDSGYILKAVPNKETNADETCTVYYNDSGIIWANSDKQNCPGYEIPKSE